MKYQEVATVTVQGVDLRLETCAPYYCRSERRDMTRLVVMGPRGHVVGWHRGAGSSDPWTLPAHESRSDDPRAWKHGEWEELAQAIANATGDVVVMGREYTPEPAEDAEAGAP